MCVITMTGDGEECKNQCKEDKYNASDNEAPTPAIPFRLTARYYEPYNYGQQTY